MGFAADSGSDLNSVGGLAEPEGSASLAEPEGAQTAEPAAGASAQEMADEAAADSVTAPTGFWITLAIGTVLLIIFYAFFTFALLQIFKMLLRSFFPLSIIILDRKSVV